MIAITLHEIDAIDDTMHPDVAIANLQAAKAAWHNKHYTPEDDVPTLAQATDDVLHHYCCTPGVLSQWLDGHCNTQNDVISAHGLIGAIGGLTVPQLLVMLFTGPAWAMNSTALQLRQKFMDESRAEAAKLAPDEIALQRRALGLS